MLGVIELGVLSASEMLCLAVVMLEQHALHCAKREDWHILWLCVIHMYTLICMTAAGSAHDPMSAVRLLYNRVGYPIFMAGKTC